MTAEELKNRVNNNQGKFNDVLATFDVITALQPDANVGASLYFVLKGLVEKLREIHDDLY